MFIAAIILSLIGFILLVVTVISNSALWTWLLIIVVAAGIVCFGAGEWKQWRRRGLGITRGR